MKVVVCAKQVPNTNEVKIDPVKGTLIRDGVESILNPDDANALEEALKLKDEYEDVTVTVISMGPPQAEVMLRECLAMGADEAILLSGREFGGSDTWATSNAISAAIEKIGDYDIIFGGRQAIDGDTAQVGPEIAEHLGLPQVTYALEAEAEGNTFRVLKEGPDYNMMIGITMPCLITFTKPGFDPRYPSIKRKMAANRAVIPVLTAADLPDIDLTRAGLKGSPTKVKKSFCPEQKKGGIIIMEDSEHASAAKLVKMLSAACLI